jgi:hypothetical protein
MPTKPGSRSECRAPPRRFRHTTVVVSLSPGSRLWAELEDALPEDTDLKAGWTLLNFGGCNSRGEEFGGNSLEVGHSPGDAVCLP